MLNFSTDQWVNVLLIFVLGLLIGGFLFSGGGRKWKHRYNTEVDRRTELERAHSVREKEWREQEKLHEATVRDYERNRVVAAPAATTTIDPRDTNRDGVVTPAEKPGIMDRMLGRDRDRDGVRDDVDPVVTPGPVVTGNRGLDRDGDGFRDDRDPVDNRKL